MTDALVDAAKKEGKLAFYTAMDLPVAEKLAKAFEAKYPGIAVRVERSGAERVFQRIAQEMASNIHAVDVVNSADARAFHRVEAQRLARALSAGGRRATFPAEHRDADGSTSRPASGSPRSATTPTW